jgi:hypothetical protein
MSNYGSAEWRPATVEAVNEIVQKDLAACDAEQKAAFDRYSVEPHPAPILRYGRIETVIVVARKGNEAVYWEDVEEGFNTSAVDDKATIAEHWCNQDTLGVALNRWIEGRPRH